MKAPANLIDTFRDSIIFRLICFIVILTTGFGFIIYKLEPAYFSTWLDGIWWSLVTIFTVGYGDYVPHTSIGKIVGMLLILLGTGFCSYFMILFATEMMNKQYMKITGEEAASSNGHMIIIGWNERAKQVVSQMSTLNPNLDIVLVDETLSLLPKPFHHLEFIKGCPHHDETLLKANIKTAHTILITADKEKNETLADTQSILNILTAKGLNPHIHCIAELLTSEQIQNATRAGATEIIEGNKLTSYVFTASLLFPSISGVLFTLYNELSESKLQLMQVPPSYVGKTFEECSHFLLKQNILLLGVKRDEQFHINPVRTLVILKSDILIVIHH
ncbi:MULTISPECIES: TrkA family potassium uptake protein [unclassified Bacillus cereus group]|uniref:potassium channel family protein n=1 Tax=unclassified Bacillus cereus group TaxID=2750818 RepID=UPI001F58FD1F|nr:MULTISPECIES: potassium channel protein [unclassified Bacillus cereus group]